MSKKIRVLVVDDSALMRKLISQVLQRDPSIEVVGTAMDGAIGLKKIDELHPHVVTLDIDMPRMDGIEATRIIRASSAHGSRIPILAITASVSPAEVRSYREAGMNDVVAKPIEASRLLEALSTAMSASPTRRRRSPPC